MVLVHKVTDKALIFVFTQLIWRKKQTQLFIKAMG